MEIFAEILGDLIFEKSLSLREIAKQSGVNVSSYSSFTKGSIPSIKVAVKISNYFECSIDYLFGLSSNRKKKYSLTYDMSGFLIKYEGLLAKNKVSHWKFCAETKGINESCIRHWKKGSSPSLSTLYVIASNLGGSIDYLIGRK